MNRLHLTTLVAISMATQCFAQYSAKVSYVSLNDTVINSHPIEEYEQPAEPSSRTAPITIYPHIEFQQIRGVGGCFNEIGGEALASLSSDQQQVLLRSLFEEDFSLCRAAIGASDFGIDAYSFSETPEDYKMEHFSLARDKKYMLPYIQAAVEINPELRIFGSPWSPPAWMKESGYMDRGVEFKSQNRLKNDPKIYEAYALYFAKYVEEYRKEGVTVDRILIQNEQDFHTKYPSCKMPVSQMSKFVKGYMRPIFEERGIECEIWAGTFRTALEADGLLFAASDEYMEAFDGIGVQYTLPQYLSDITTLAPKLNVMHTESKCFNGENSAEQAATRFEEVANYINGGSDNFAYWNMILNETGLSGWEWRQNALVTIDRRAKSVTYNPDYAVMKLMSRFLKAGATRIGAFSRSTLISTEHDGKYYLIMQNDAKKPMTYRCAIDGEVILFEVPAESLCGVEISKNP